MPRINLLPDELVETATPSERTLESPPEAPAMTECPGCLGKGRYVGLMAVEDPCRFCNGSGVMNAQGSKGRSAWDEAGPPKFGDDELPF